MKKYNNYEYISGAIVLFIMFVVLMFSSSFMPKAMTLGNTYYVKVDKVKGLKIGASVKVSDFTVGQVRGIDLLDDYRINIKMVIDKELVIRKDAMAWLKIDEVNSEYFINLYPGGLTESILDGEAIN